MNKILCLAVFVILAIPVIASSYALQEVAGKITLQLNPGEKQYFRWGLLSDSNDTITVSITAVGNGSQFLSFPTSVTLQPKQITYVNVNASIPSNYAGKSILSPLLFATQAGKQGGPTVLNIAVQKLVTLNITGAQNAQPQMPIPIAQPKGAVPEFPSITGVTLVVAMSVVFVVFSKRNHGLFKPS